MFQVEALGAGVGTHAPLGIWRGGGTLEADRLHVVLADVPRLAAIVGLVEFVTVAAGAGAMIDRQFAASLVLEVELLDGPETRLIEDGMRAPCLTAIGGHQQKWILGQRRERNAAAPTGLGAGKLNVVQTSGGDAFMHFPPGLAVVLRA